MIDLSNLSVLLVDDEPAWLHGLSLTLERSGISAISCCNDSRKALPKLRESPMDLVLLDITMPHLTGEELLRQIGEEFPNLPVIILTGINQIELSVRCIKAGAFDFLVKTVDQQQVLASIQRAAKMLLLQRENRQLNQNFLQHELRHPEVFREIIGRSPQILAICAYLEAVAPGPTPILLYGESGPGKELFARAIHQLSRGREPWVAVNVAGLDDNMFSDTLFGHVRGAFTGADTPRAGMIESAGEGTLFLDEIGDLPPNSQVKLLRLLQEGEYLPLGADRPHHSKARIVLATNRDLEQEIQAGRFRRDLYYRLSTHRVTLPPLRNRSEDIQDLLAHLLEKQARVLGKKTPAYPAELVQLLMTYHFPGNIRELEGMVANALGTHQRGTLSMRSFQDALGRGKELLTNSDPTNKLIFTEQLPTLEEAGQLLVSEALKRSQGNQTLAARLLGITRPALSKRIKKFQA